MCYSVSAKHARRLAVILLLIHAVLLAWSGSRHSPCWDEVGHLPAGISHWRFGDFRLYRVNPPLVRMVAAVPVMVAGSKGDWGGYVGGAIARPEFGAGSSFIRSNGERSFWLFTLARWACLPLSILGGYVCFRWAGELYGRLAGILALSLWSFSPNILAHGQLITPDMGAAALGVAAAYAFWRWLERPGWARATVAGLVMGLAELTKLTWIILFGLWPVLWLVLHWGRPREGMGKQARAPERAAGRARGGRAREAWQMAWILLVGLYVINTGYAYEGSFRRLGDYEFVSRALGGATDDRAMRLVGRNRFAGTWLGLLPVPLPTDYVAGIDLQKRDFERTMWSYLGGQWRRPGWWYYYLYGLAIKVPLGTWVLVLLAAGLGLLARGHSAGWRSEVLLLSPMLVILTLVSSQTGFNHHLRYVLPVFPFAFIWASKVARAVERSPRKVAPWVMVALVGSVGSSLWVYPHSLSYFNALAGGPTGGHYHLGASNVDWGQDLLYLRRWLEKHPEAQPLRLAYDLPLVDPGVAGIQSTLPPEDPRPGWHAISVNQIHGRRRSYLYFLRFGPEARIGYSFHVYHIPLQEANRVRRELGFAELPGVERGGGSD